MTALLIDPREASAVQTVTVFVGEVPTSADPRSEAALTYPELPVAVPRSQLYYWSRLWREGVRLSREAVARGEYVDFASDDPYDVIRWLFAEDDE